MRLSKHHGLGNDFLVVLDQGDASADLARRLCDRHRGIGADGLISGRTAVSGEHTEAPDVVMVLRNADGGRAEMSGNGIRCLAQAVLRRRGEGSGTVTVATDAGIRCVTVEPGDGTAVSMADVDLGPARPGPAWAVDDLPAGLLRALGTSAVRAETIDLGNPHLVIEAADPAAIDLAHFGPLLEASFPHGVNVEFVGLSRRASGRGRRGGVGARRRHHRRLRDRRLRLRRGGTPLGLVGRDVTVHLPGGAVCVHLGATITLSGAVVHIADIDVPDEDDPRAIVRADVPRDVRDARV